MDTLTKDQINTNLSNFKSKNQDSFSTTPQVGGATTDTGITQDGVTPITSTTVSPTSTVKIPEIQPSTTASGITGAAQALVDQNKAALATAQANKDQSTSDLKSLQEQILGVQSSRLQAETEAKLAEKQQRATDITNQIEADLRAQQNEEQAILANGSISKEAQNSLIQNIRTKHATYQADLSILQSAANRDYSTAQSIIDRKIQLQLEPLQTKLDFAKTFYQDNKDMFSKAEDRQFKALETQAQREYDTQEAFKKRVGDLQLQAAKDGNLTLFNNLSNVNDEKGLKTAVLDSVIPTGGDTKAQATAKAIFSGTSNLTIKDVPQKDRPAVDAALNALKTEALKSGDIYGVIRASAGGAPTSDIFNNSFEKALNVSGQLNDLNETIKNGKTITNADGSKTKIPALTGPISGIIRSNNPFDTKAQLIKAQLQAIVPNLARGVYGEVGVLTDNDIANYSKTLANLTSTEDVNAALMGIAIKSVQRSLDNKIKTAAGLGKDVSGILETYKSVREAADEQLAAPIEAASEKVVTDYIKANPTNKIDIESKIKSAQDSVGRPITYTEFLEVYPEYKK